MLCEDGILLLEVNRMLRAGGYFAWAAQPVYKHEAVLEEQWEGNVLIMFYVNYSNADKHSAVSVWSYALFRLRTSVIFHHFALHSIT